MPLPAAVLAILEKREPAVTKDPFWRALARRLAAANRHGENLEGLMLAALDQGRLPDERPAAAPWFRLAGQLNLTSVTTDADTRLRPDWTDQFLRLLPERISHRVLTDPQWPNLVAVVDEAVARTELSAGDLLE